MFNDLCSLEKKKTKLCFLLHKILGLQLCKSQNLYVEKSLVTMLAIYEPMLSLGDEISIGLPR